MAAAKNGTMRNANLVDPENPTQIYSIASLRGEQRGKDNGIRQWEYFDLVPRPDDVFQERLYYVRWVSPEGERFYKSVTEADLDRERKVLVLLQERFSDCKKRVLFHRKRCLRRVRKLKSQSVRAGGRIGTICLTQGNCCFKGQYTKRFKRMIQF